ncbi:MAG: MFS transporter [Rhodocyclaceae bacterium]|nr:MFS transporter [Rhodocyclaceae bacterium]
MRPCFVVPLAMVLPPFARSNHVWCGEYITGAKMTPNLVDCMACAHGRYAPPMSLLTSRRFGPLFATQFLGAFNDNLYKNALVLLVLYQGFGAVESPGLLVNLAAGLFILPFLLLSASAGHWADTSDKARIARLTKWLEVAVVLLGAAGLLAGSLWLSLAALTLLGAQSALFGPVKYGVLPQHLQPDELLAGNAWIEAATFLAILLGTLVAGVLVTGEGAVWRVSGLALLVAAAGLAAVHGMPAAPPVGAAFPPDAASSSASVGRAARLQTELAVSANLAARRASERAVEVAVVDPLRAPLRATARLLADARSEPVWPVLLAISWFWAFGATVLTQLPIIVRDHLHGDATVVSALLAVFSVGVGAGSALAAALLRRVPDLPVVPAAALDMALLGGLLVWLLPVGNGAVPVLGLAAWWAAPTSIATTLTLFALATAGDAYCVPLYTALQRLAAPERRGRAVAANNVVNSGAMVAAAGTGAGLSAAGIGADGLVALFAAGNVPVAWWLSRHAVGQV